MRETDLPNTKEMKRALAVLFELGQVVELRAFATRRNTISGYFDDPDGLVREAEKINRRWGTVYVTLNVLEPALLARRANRVVEFADQTTSDQHVVRRRWLPIDLDPIRPPGISASETEHQAAIDMARRVRGYLVNQLGWPEPVAADSGNGSHVLCPIDLPNDDAAAQLIRDCLSALDFLFSSEQVNVDTGNYNASRIWKLYGTISTKGDHTPDRPHRLARLLNVPDAIEVVSTDQLRSLAELVPSRPEYSSSADTPSFDVEEWLTLHDIPVRYAADYQGRNGGGRKWILEQCVWNSEHTDKSAYVLQFDNGGISAGCHHNSCRGKGWSDLRSIVEKPALTVQDLTEHKDLISQDEFPHEIDPAAYYGLAGDVVRAVAEHSEAAEVAILIQFLTAFGNAAGRTAHFMAESDAHYLKLFVCLVGETSKGRKGTSWGHIARLFRLADETWVKNHVVTGLSSGEGVIWAVRDEIRQQKPKKEKGEIVGYHEVISDEGVLDKRLLCLETEFASTLKVMSREGNTLSAVLRNAWDRGNLRTLTKNSPAEATDTHISVVAHVTAAELRRYLTTTEASNGFGNRFIWIAVRRSKCLPDGGNLGDEQLRPLALKLREALDAARFIERMDRDDETRKLWHSVYPALSEGAPGMFGALTSRAEAQTMRLACIYAALDHSVMVRPCHLEAALAVWEYAEATVRFVFGDSTGDPVADEILAALRHNRNGLSRDELRKLFGGHRSADVMGRSLGVLVKHGLAYSVKQKTGGRPREVWYAGRAACLARREGRDS